MFDMQPNCLKKETKILGITAKKDLVWDDGKRAWSVNNTRYMPPGMAKCWEQDMVEVCHKTKGCFCSVPKSRCHEWKTDSDWSGSLDRSCDFQSLYYEGQGSEFSRSFSRFGTDTLMGLMSGEEMAQQGVKSMSSVTGMDEKTSNTVGSVVDIFAGGATMALGGMMGMMKGIFSAAKGDKHKEPKNLQEKMLWKYKCNKRRGD